MIHSSTWKKIFLLVLIATFFAPQLFGSYAQAQGANPIPEPLNYGGAFTPAGIGKEGACDLENLGSWLLCVFLIPVAWFIGLLVSLGAAAITLGLEMNAGLAYTTPIQSGFNVTLAIANLGFVFAIIVIAIATIINYESYGMKKNLWKLVAAALLVNFSLVICSLIIGFFDQFAYYFARQMGNSGGGYSGVSNHLVNAFQLNKLSGWQAAGSFVPTLIFIMIFLLIIAFTLFAIAFNLIIRYFYLAILMILMPFAWLAWIMPSTKKHWDSWWEHFMKWTLSPTIILTLLYVAILVVGSAGTSVEGIGQSQIDKWVGGSAAGPAQVVNDATGRSGGETITSIFVRIIISMALVWGALIAANSLGAKGGSTILKWGNSIGKGSKKWATGYATRYGSSAAKRGATYALRTERGRAATEYLQTRGRNSESRFLRGLGKIPFTATLGTALSQARQAGEKTQSDAAKAYKDMSLIEQARQYSSASGVTGERFAILMNVQKALKAAQDKKAKADSSGDEKQKAAAQKELEEVEKAMGLLPQKVKSDLDSYTEAMSRGYTAEAKNETKYGRKFILYGEHEKKHKKSLEDELKERFKEEDHGKDKKSGDDDSGKKKSGDTPKEPPKADDHGTANDGGGHDAHH